MFLDAALVDLDDTLYSYEDAHGIALQVALMHLSSVSHIDVEILKRKYASISRTLKYELGMTASSHSRFIYFKQLCGSFKISLDLVQPLHDLYWNSFYEAMTPAHGAADLLRTLRTCGIRVAILTDFQIEYQFMKLKRLNLLHLIDDVISSEEVGVEKPNSKMFLTGLARLNARPERTLMIGDNFFKDIEGASNCGIQGLWIAKEKYNNAPSGHLTFPDLMDVNVWILEQAHANAELIQMP